MYQKYFLCKILLEWVTCDAKIVFFNMYIYTCQYHIFIRQPKQIIKLDFIFGLTTCQPKAIKMEGTSPHQSCISMKTQMQKMLYTTFCLQTPMIKAWSWYHCICTIMNYTPHKSIGRYLHKILLQTSQNCPLANQQRLLRIEGKYLDVEFWATIHYSWETRFKIKYCSLNLHWRKE